MSALFVCLKQRDGQIVLIAKVEEHKKMLLKDALFVMKV